MHHLLCGGKKSVLEKQQLKTRLRILGRKGEKGEEIGNQIVKNGLMNVC